MVDTVDRVEEHSGVNPISATGDGGTTVSHEEFNVALDTLKTSMTTEVESMFNKFLEGLKLSTSPMKVGDPTNKVTDANSDKGEATSEKAPSTSDKKWQWHLFPCGTSTYLWWTDSFHPFESCRSSPLRL